MATNSAQITTVSVKFAFCHGMMVLRAINQRMHKHIPLLMLQR